MSRTRSAGTSSMPAARRPRPARIVADDQLGGDRSALLGEGRIGGASRTASRAAVAGAPQTTPSSTATAIQPEPADRGAGDWPRPAEQVQGASAAAAPAAAGGEPARSGAGRPR